MTILTPTFAEQAKPNGAAGRVHVEAAHEPTGEGEKPPLALSAANPVRPVAAVAAPLKVALIGTAPSSRMLAPYGDPSWKIWACSPGNMNSLPRVDTWFELHSNLLWPEHESYGRPYIEWLKVQSFPVYMQDQSLVPNAQIFPMHEIVAEFGQDFFTSSFAWMMALAMKMGATEIALYGIDMASRDEYIRQRPGFYFFRYMAQQRGIKVTAPHESDIMQSPPLYAYVDSTPFGRKIHARRTEINGRIGPLDQQIGQATNSKVYLQGALEDVDYFESIWSGVANDISLARYEALAAQTACAALTAENDALKAEIARIRMPVFEPMTMTISATQDSAIAQADNPPIKRRRRKRERQPEPVQELAPVTESHDGELLDH